MRVLTKYAHEYDSVSDALDDMRTRRRVTDIPIRLGDADSIEFYGDQVFVRGAPGPNRMPMSRPFLDSFCQQVEPHFPVKFAQDVPADLFADNANRLMRMAKNKGRRLTVRIEDWLDSEGELKTRTAHSLVTDAYQFIDHEAVLERAAALGANGSTVVLTDSMLRIKTLTEAFEIRTPHQGIEVFKVGHEIINSETRTHRLAVAAFVLRQWCTNGCVAPVPGLGDSFKRRHVVDPEEALEQVSEILGAISWAAAEGGFRHRLERMIAEPIAPHMLTYYRSEVERYAGEEISNKIWEGSFEIDKNEPMAEQPTRWDVFNKVTRAARELEPGPQRELEAWAGKTFLADLEANGSLN